MSPERPSQPSESPARAPPSQEDVLGRRISAALIDLTLLLGLLVVLALTIGESEVEGGSVSLSLNGADAGLYFGLVFLYYFGLEAALGQTVGKLLLGLRVVRPDGSQPSLFAIAVRNLLRIVDWLPLLYLVGFIAMMATGPRRQRLGDLAGKTSLARAPVRHRSLALAPFALLLLAILGLSVYRASDSDEGKSGPELTYVTSNAAGQENTSKPRKAACKGCYRGHLVSFNYPPTWRKTEDFRAPISDLWGVTLVLKKPSDFVRIIGEGEGEYGFPASDLVSFKAFIVDQLKVFDWRVEPGSEKLAVDGRPGLRFRAGFSSGGRPTEQTIVMTFKGKWLYRIECTHHERAAEIERGCAQILRTFKVGTP